MNYCFLLKIQIVISRISSSRFLDAKASFHREDKNRLKMYVSFPFTIFFSSGRSWWVWTSASSPSFHIREVVILERENFKKSNWRSLTQFNSVMIFCLDFVLVSVTGTTNPSPSFIQFWICFCFTGFLIEELLIRTESNPHHILCSLAKSK